MRKNIITVILLSLLPIIFILNNISIFTRHTTISPSYLTVHFIDVGQGDSILIQINNKNMLIDSGPSESSDKLFDFLDSHNISTLDYVIATHPHEDHIGNMAEVIKKYNIKSFYSPKVITSEKSFENMVYSLKSKKIKINVLKKNSSSINLGKNTSIIVYSPENNSYDNINNYSVVMKISYKNNSFIFTGDAEKEVEQSILSQNNNLSCDVLKIGHHGSSTSTTEDFLNACNPSIAVISVGEYNEFNHPDSEIIDRLVNCKCKIYRTDKDKSVTLISDGNSIRHMIN